MPRFQLHPLNESLHFPSLEDDTPVTSLPCQWKPPKKRKESTLPIEQAQFEKHTYGKMKKRKLALLNNFDPRPAQYRGTAANNLPTLLETISGNHLCISLLFDKRFQIGSGPEPTDLKLPDRDSLKATVEAFKASLSVTAEKIREIECTTRQQRSSPLWYDVRRYRLTASLFGLVQHRKPDTPPDSLVKRILQPQQFSSAATDWGITHEAVAIEQYIEHMHSQGHIELSVVSCGFHISQSHPYLGASPDGAVYDPTSTEQPFGFLEIKCPYNARNKSPLEACTLPNFFCTTVRNVDGEESVVLRTSHSYYAQIQGQMAIGGRPWCDFVVYTSVGINVQRVLFDPEFWHNSLLPKLTDFYDNCIGPEIVSPVRSLGLPIRNLKKDHATITQLPLQDLQDCMTTTLPTVSTATVTTLTAVTPTMTTTTMTTSNVTTKSIPSTAPMIGPQPPVLRRKSTKSQQFTTTAIAMTTTTITTTFSGTSTNY